MIWLIPIAAVASCLLTYAVIRFLSGRSETTRQISRQASLKKIEEKEGRDAAIMVVETEHKKTLESLDTEQKKEAESLRGNPSALSDFLVELGKRG